MIDADAWANAVPGIAGEAYKDLVQPAAREAGATAGRAVRAALAPVRGALWTAEQAEKYVVDKVTQWRSEAGRDETSIQPAPPHIAAPVIWGVATAGDESIREMFARLLATSIDVETSSLAHPGFADVIRQLSQPEAKLIANVVHGPIMGKGTSRRRGLVRKGQTLPAGVSWTTDLTRETWPEALSDVLGSGSDISFLIDNLERLGLVRRMVTPHTDGGITRAQRRLPDDPMHRMELEESCGVTIAVRLTAFGSGFAKACLPLAEKPGGL